jgi:hypothetical protein
LSFATITKDGDISVGYLFAQNFCHLESIPTPAISQTGGGQRALMLSVRDYRSLKIHCLLKFPGVLSK